MILDRQGIDIILRKIGRQRRGIDLAASGHRREALPFQCGHRLGNVLQLADVARPAVARKQLYRVSGQ